MFVPLPSCLDVSNCKWLVVSRNSTHLASTLDLVRGCMVLWWSPGLVSTSPGPGRGSARCWPSSPWASHLLVCTFPGAGMGSARCWSSSPRLAHIVFCSSPGLDTASARCGTSLSVSFGKSVLALCSAWSNCGSPAVTGVSSWAKLIIPWSSLYLGGTLGVVRGCVYSVFYD